MASVLRSSLDLVARFQLEKLLSQQQVAASGGTTVRTQGRLITRGEKARHLVDSMSYRHD